MQVKKWSRNLKEPAKGYIRINTREGKNWTYQDMKPEIYAQAQRHPANPYYARPKIKADIFNRKYGIK